MTHIKRFDKKTLGRKPKPLEILTNEQVSLYFLKETSKKDVNPLSADSKIKQKNYTNEYVGNLHRTYSYLDLLSLHQIEIALKQGQEFYVPD